VHLLGGERIRTRCGNPEERWQAGAWAPKPEGLQ
jgi:hypothetical protein